MGFLYRAESVICVLGPIGRRVVSLVRSLAYKKTIRIFIDHDGDWVNQQEEVTLYSPTANRSVYSTIEGNVKDFWYYDYTPRPGDVVFDIGAGVGADTVVFASHVGPNGSVYAFEANPNIARCLQKTIRDSKCQSVYVHPVAVADAEGTVCIEDGKHDLSNSIICDTSANVVEVPSVTLDAFVEKHGIGRIDFLKMNIEGAEKQALEGFSKHFDIVQNVAISCHDWLAGLGHSEDFKTKQFVADYLQSQGMSLVVRGDDSRSWIAETIYACRANHREA